MYTVCKLHQKVPYIGHMVLLLWACIPVCWSALWVTTNPICMHASMDILRSMLVLLSLLASVCAILRRDHLGLLCLAYETEGPWSHICCAATAHPLNEICKVSLKKPDWLILLHCVVYVNGVIDTCKAQHSITNACAVFMNVLVSGMLFNDCGTSCFWTCML